MWRDRKNLTSDLNLAQPNYGETVVSFHCNHFLLTSVISLLENTEFKLIVMCNVFRLFGCISTVKSYKPKLYCSLNDRADFCTVGW